MGCRAVASTDPLGRVLGVLGLESEQQESNEGVEMT